MEVPVEEDDVETILYQYDDAPHSPTCNVFRGLGIDDNKCCYPDSEERKLAQELYVMNSTLIQ